MPKRREGLLAIVVLFSLLIVSFNSIVQVNANPDAVLATIKVGSYPSEIVVNPTNDRIYVTNNLGTTVSIIDGSSNAVVGNITGLNSPYGVDVNPKTGKIYVTSSSSDLLYVIDGTTNALTATIKLDTKICYTQSCTTVAENPSTNRIYVANPASNSVYVLDGTSDTVVNNITVGSLPYEAAVNANDDMVYVANYGSPSISVIDGAKTSVVATISNLDGSPFALSVNPNTNKVYVALDYYSHTVAVIDASNNTEVAAITLPSLSSRDAQISGNFLSVNPNTNMIYVPEKHTNVVSLIDGSTNKIAGNITVGINPWQAVTNPNTNRIYVTNRDSNTVSVIDGSTPVPEFPTASLAVVALISLAVVAIVSRRFSMPRLGR